MDFPSGNVRAGRRECVSRARAGSAGDRAHGLARCARGRAGQAECRHGQCRYGRGRSAEVYRHRGCGYYARGVRDQYCGQILAGCQRNRRLNHTGG